MEKIKENIIPLIGGLVLSIAFAIIANIVGFNVGIVESLPGLFILAVLSLLGYILSYIIPIKKITSILWISLLAILIASPISPVSEQVIYFVGRISLMSIVTPILGYAGVVVGKDWNAFKELGVKAIIVSFLVIAGTFLVSSLLGDLFMKVFS